MSQNNQPIKVVLLGESGVGKTSIIQQFTSHTFDRSTLTSLSCQYSSQTIKLKELNKTITFDIWDTAGQERYRSLAKIYYKDAKIIIFVYDITNKNSFDSIKTYWMEQIQLYTYKKPIFGLVSNKDDLYKSQQVSLEEGKEFADKINAIFQTTSAKNDFGIQQLFINLGKKILVPDFDYKIEDIKAKQNYESKKKKKRSKSYNVEEEEKNKGKVKLKKIKNNNKKKGCC